MNEWDQKSSNKSEQTILTVNTVNKQEWMTCIAQ